VLGADLVERYGDLHLEERVLLRGRHGARSISRSAARC
jgi:hypothetical protein